MDSDISPDIAKSLGQMFMAGFSGQEVTPEVRELIEKYHVGSFILSVKNLKDAESTRLLVQQLQQIAHDAGHTHPLLIAIDQEGGMLNNLHDPKYLSQFPGAMAMVATKDSGLAEAVAHATGLQLMALGINWLFGPVLDVLTNSTNKLLGVRTMGDDPQQVTKFGLSCLKGYSEAGLVCCGKHFPGYGNATLDSTLGLPIVPESLEQLEISSLIPFRQAVNNGIEAIMVGGCALPKIAMHEMHACLSERVCRDLLRQDMHFDGIILSECLEMDTLYENVGVKQGAVMAAVAGCDMMFVCSSYRLQLEALSGLIGAVQSGIIDESTVRMSAARVDKVKASKLTWEQALNPKPLSYLVDLKKQNLRLSKTAYEKAVTLVRDHAGTIPLTHSVEPDADILLLTPLVSPLISTRVYSDSSHLLFGETVFQEFGKSLAKFHSGKVLHASYTANGAIGIHDVLIERARAVIIVTADAHRNMYQIGFVKYVSAICAQQKKPVAVVAASSPYDMALDRTVGTYICSYEFTNEALTTVARVLFGQLTPKGIFPGSGLYQRTANNNTGPAPSRTKNRWLVEKWSSERDLIRLKTLWENCFPERRLGPNLAAFHMLLRSSNQQHFIVRNSSTNNLYGFCATWVYEKANVGCIAMVFVEPSRRNMYIGTSLHDRALKYLIEERKVKKVHIGSSIPSFFHGIPASHFVSLSQWFQNCGWMIDTSRAKALLEASSSTSSSMEKYSPSLLNTTTSTSNGSHSHGPAAQSINIFAPPVGTGSSIEPSKLQVVSTMLLTFLQEWSPPPSLIQDLSAAGLKFEICSNDAQYAQVSSLITSQYADSGLLQLYEEARNGRATKIVLAMDPELKNVLGALILFTRMSAIAGYMPWILEFEDARVGGLCGLVTDERATPEAIAKGIVGCCLSQFKSQGFERCVMDGVSSLLSPSLVSMGFHVWRHYLEVENLSACFVL